MSEIEIIVIGTIHSSWTPHDKLIALLEEHDPDKLLLELSPEELSEERRKSSIRDEMFAAYDWAKENGTSVDVFDEENDVLREGVTGQESVFEEHAQRSEEILRGYSWKDLNKDEPWNDPAHQELEEKLDTYYIDPDKSQQRESNLIRKIEKLLEPGRNVVLVGVGHLAALENQLPRAQFPLRN